MTTDERLILGTGLEVTGLLEAAEVGEEALAEANESESPKALAEALIEKGLMVDAVKYLSHALPVRAGVYWAWKCVRDAAGESPAAEVSQGLTAMEAWIARPGPDTRQAAFETGHALGFDTPVGAVGAAIFLSAESLAPPDQPVSPPPPYAASKSVLGAVSLAALMQEDDVLGRFKVFMETGMEVAEKAGIWSPPGATGATAAGR